ncbi:uncharacterized protein LOC18425041 [Amborella trichopoda]|uniref:F-box domain-containing protein n=1 Tax=Amborella trichopoda TaxID=13333 RepID=W1NN81_AMBTC|nr:uncharacterized protein LOC18425041 [Amborella trichopoda]ERM97091.1 hypothetical protein AMTR_s00122p00137900 [Amborella trichopoda]|eukprot:XP_006829675.1 uncharacterized protein LOC18425041 [Amborella trichopoda]
MESDQNSGPFCHIPFESSNCRLKFWPHPPSADENSSEICQIPGEILQSILLRLPFSDLLITRSTCKCLAGEISGQEFRSLYDKTSQENWLYLYKKKPLKTSSILAYSDMCRRWFKIPIAGIFASAINSGEDLYLLAASKGFVLFALNRGGELVAGNLVSGAVKKIPAGPLGPRRTCTWRRYGLTMVAGTSSFEFLFAESIGGQPVVFVYNSETESWRVIIAKPFGNFSARKREILSASHVGEHSTLVSIDRESDMASILRPKFEGKIFSVYETHVFGDGWMMVVKSEGFGTCGRVMTHVEIWGLGLGGERWELRGQAPREMLERESRVYDVMMGCLEERESVIRAVLVSNLKGKWDMVWVCFDMMREKWEFNFLPQCDMEGGNIAGIAISSSLPLMSLNSQRF